MYIKRVLIIQMVILKFGFSSFSQDTYNLHGNATDISSFTDNELSNLKQLRQDWIDIGENFLLNPINPDNIIYNIFLDSISPFDPKNPQYVINDGKFLASELNWTKKYNFLHFGIVGNNWSGHSLNENLIYTVDSIYTFFIFNRQGQELFSFPTYDTLENGQIFEFYANYAFTLPSKNVGCFILNRINKKTHSTAFRIYDLLGKPLCSWKTKDINWQIDPYFGGYITSTYDNVEILSFTGENLFSKNNCRLIPVNSSSQKGIYEIIDNVEYEFLLLNFLGKQVKCKQRNKRNLHNYKIKIKE
ncbi:MAG: hypothetical protein ACI9G9_000175 [Psychromonas sp.]|jgi:hypothetical protein